MSELFYSRTIAKYLNISPHTIRRWVKLFPDYFSASAIKGANHRASYTADDAIVFATIQHLLRQGYRLDSLEQPLKEGYRYSAGVIEGLQLGESGENIDTSHLRTTPTDLQLASQQLEHYRELEVSFLSEVKTLNQQISDLRYELGMAQGELKALREHLNRTD